jgi:hypothetical protein
MLNQRPCEQAITYLLTYLPLFNKNIADLKAIYLNILKRIHDETLNKSLKSVCSYNEYYHLLIIASIHPAFSREEQNEFENNAKSIQKKFQSINLNINNNNFSSHHDYNINDENDFDEGFSSHPSISEKNSTNNNNNNENIFVISNISNDLNTPTRHLTTKPPISHCFSAPPKIETNSNNNTNSSEDNDENSDDDDEDDDDNDDENEDDEYDDYNNSPNKDKVSGSFDENNNSSSLFGKKLQKLMFKINLFLLFSFNKIIFLINSRLIKISLKYRI